MAKKTKKKEFRRHPVGINILWGRAGVRAYQLYDITYDDGSCGIELGRTVRTLPGFEDLNGTKAEIKEASKSLRPDLDAAMQAAHILLARIGEACWNLDAPKKKGK